MSNHTVLDTNNFVFSLVVYSLVFVSSCLYIYLLFVVIHKNKSENLISALLSSKIHGVFLSFIFAMIGLVLPIKNISDKISEKIQKDTIYQDKLNNKALMGTVNTHRDKNEGKITLSTITNIFSGSKSVETSIKKKEIKDKE